MSLASIDICFLPGSPCALSSANAEFTRRRTSASLPRTLGKVARRTRCRSGIVKCSVTPDAGRTNEDGGSRKPLSTNNSTPKLIPDEHATPDHSAVLPAERQSVEQVTESGKGQLRSVAGEVNNELQSIEASNTAYGDALVTEELEKALGDFDEKKAALLNNVKEQRDIIQAEVSKIESLAKDLKALDKKSTKAARRKDLLFSLSGLFGVAALWYAWLGVTGESSSDIQNAVVNALAACAALFARNRYNDEENA